MSPEVSRALGEVRHRLQLGPSATADLAKRFADVETVADLPEWIRRLVVEEDAEGVT